MQWIDLCFEGGGAMLKHMSKVKIDCYVLDIHVAPGKGKGMDGVIGDKNTSSSRYWFASRF